MNLLLGILRYSILGPTHWILTILSYILVPFLVLFQKDGWLPKWCWWFQTWDNSLDGDEGWILKHRPWLSTPYYQLSSFQLYWSRVLWLYRNPVYGFERAVLAANPNQEYTIYGQDISLGDEWSNPPFQEGQKLIVDSKGYFFWNGFKKVTSTKALNWLIGWKLRFPDKPTPICTTIRFINYK